MNPIVSGGTFEWQSVAYIMARFFWLRPTHPSTRWATKMAICSNSLTQLNFVREGRHRSQLMLPTAQNERETRERHYVCAMWASGKSDLRRPQSRAHSK